MHNHKFTTVVGVNNNTNFECELFPGKYDKNVIDLHMTMYNSDSDSEAIFSILGISSKNMHKLADNLKEMAFTLDKAESKQIDIFKK